MAAQSWGSQFLSSRQQKFIRVKNCLDPEWIEPIYLECPEDESIHVIVEIWDDNRGKEEDVRMGKALVNVKTALEEPEDTTKIDIESGGT